MKKEILKIGFKPLSLVNKFIKKNEKLIFFYSNLGFRDNVRAFYEYLIAQNYNEEYQIVVSINDVADYKECYFSLMRATERTIRLLVEAQRTCEEMILNAPQENLVLLTKEEGKEDEV